MNCDYMQLTWPVCRLILAGFAGGFLLGMVAGGATLVLWALKGQQRDDQEMGT